MHVTGHDAIMEANENGETARPERPRRGADRRPRRAVILFFVFGTLPAVLLPLAIAVSSILNTFTLVWILTYVTDVSIIVQFLIALVGLGVAIDYALLMVFRFRDELREGQDVETALVETMTHAGKAVIVSGSTVAVGLLSLIVVAGAVHPLDRHRRDADPGGVGARGDHAAPGAAGGARRADQQSSGCCRSGSSTAVTPKTGRGGAGRDSSTSRPVPIAAVGLAITGVLVFYGFQLNPNEAQLKNVAGKGDAIVGRDALRTAGITPGVLKPLDVLVENGARPGSRRRATGRASTGSPPPSRRRTGAKATRRSSRRSRPSTAPIRESSRSSIAPKAALKGTDATVGGTAAVDRDLVHAIYGNFAYLLAFVLALTYILLARAFRSLVLPLKAVLLNLVSLAAAFGIVVIVFQLGHGSGIWGIDAMQAINPWIPIMIFAFLFGLSMDYEVFMLTRMREAYDETGSTSKAIELGLARTGKLVTSGALVLMCAFLAALLRAGLRDQGARNRARRRNHLRRDGGPRPARARR